MENQTELDAYMEVFLKVAPPDETAEAVEESFLEYISKHEE